MVPHWVPPTIILAYAGIVILFSFTGVFGETAERRQAACTVLRLLLPWGVIGVATEAVVRLWGPA
jgi:hypothetical protein